MLVCKIKYETCRGGMMFTKFKSITLIPYPTDLIFCYRFHTVSLHVEVITSFYYSEVNKYIVLAKCFCVLNTII